MSAYVPPAMRAKVAPETYGSTGLSKKSGASVKIDTTSIKDFPTLGSGSGQSSGPKKTWGRPGGADFAGLAKAWAEKDDDEKKRKDEEELRRVEEESRNRPVQMRRIRSQDLDASRIYSNYPVSMTEDNYSADYHSDCYDIYDSHNIPNTMNGGGSNPLGIKRDDFEF